MTKRDELLALLRQGSVGKLSMDEFLLLKDSVKFACERAREIIECTAFVDGEFWDVGEPRSKLAMGEMNRALSFLSRLGLIERKPGAEHLVRFVGE